MTQFLLAVLWICDWIRFPKWYQKRSGAQL